VEGKAAERYDISRIHQEAKKYGWREVIIT
jgi:hypothetical protein